jgi:hypothetical protein
MTLKMPNWIILTCVQQTLAEFIIHLAQQNKDAKTFRAALHENGAEFPAALSEKLFSIVDAMTGKPTHGQGQRREHGARRGSPCA